MHGVGGKLLSGIKCMYVDSLACVRIKGSKNEQFRLDRGVSFPLGFSMYIWMER